MLTELRCRSVKVNRIRIHVAEQSKNYKFPMRQPAGRNVELEPENRELRANLERLRGMLGRQ
jgi:hypothetical protein